MLRKANIKPIWVCGFWAGEERPKVMSALEDLVKAKVLMAHRATSTTGYSYTSDDKLISKIGKLLKKRKSP